MTSPPDKVKTALLALVAALCLQTATAAQTPAPQPAKWERYTFPGDEFSVELPGMPFVYHTDRAIGPNNDEIEKVRVFGVYADGVVYMVAAFDRPRERESAEDFLGYVEFGRISPGGAPRAVKAGKFEGTEFRKLIQLPAPPASDPPPAPDAGPPSGRVFETSRVFKAKSRAYLVKAFSREERHPSVARFLDSLALSPRPQGREISAATGGGDGGEPVARSADDPNRVFLQKEVTVRAAPLYKGDPGFTVGARKNNVTGVVRLRVVFNATGRVTNVSVIKSLPEGLTERAVHAARHILFFPAQKNGRDVSQYVTLEYNFNIYY